VTLFDSKMIIEVGGAHEGSLVTIIINSFLNLFIMYRGLSLANLDLNKVINSVPFYLEENSVSVS
jgi:hypothetical protein